MEGYNDYLTFHLITNLILRETKSEEGSNNPFQDFF